MKRIRQVEIQWEAGNAEKLNSWVSRTDVGVEVAPGARSGWGKAGFRFGTNLAREQTLGHMAAAADWLSGGSGVGYLRVY